MNVLMREYAQADPTYVAKTAVRDEKYFNFIELSADCG
jgi:hypothetical protein